MSVGPAPKPLQVSEALFPICHAAAAAGAVSFFPGALPKPVLLAGTGFVIGRPFWLLPPAAAPAPPAALGQNRPHSSF